MVAIEYKNADHETRDRITTMLVHNGIIPKSVGLNTMDYSYETGELSYMALRAVGEFKHDQMGLGGSVAFQIDPSTNQWVSKPMTVKLAWQPWEFDVLQRGVEYELERDGGAPVLSEGAL